MLEFAFEYTKLCRIKIQIVENRNELIRGLSNSLQYGQFRALSRETLAGVLKVLRIK